MKTRKISAVYAVAAAFLLAAAGAEAGEYKSTAKEFARAAARYGVKKVAVVDLVIKGTASKDEAAYAAEKLSGCLSATRKVDVIERALLEKVAGERKLMSALGPDDDLAKDLSRLLRVDAIVTGMVFATEGRLKTIFKLISLESGKVLETGEIETDRELPAGAFQRPEQGFSSGFRDAVRDPVAVRDCVEERREVDRLNSMAVALKAKYWSAKLRSPGLSGSASLKEPGSELRNPETRRLFDEILAGFNGAGESPELSLDDFAALETVWNLERSFAAKCGVPCQNSLLLSPA